MLWGQHLRAGRRVSEPGHGVALLASHWPGRLCSAWTQALLCQGRLCPGRSVQTFSYSAHCHGLPTEGGILPGAGQESLWKSLLIRILETWRRVRPGLPGPGSRHGSRQRTTVRHLDGQLPTPPAKPADTGSAHPDSGAQGFSLSTQSLR